jgi:hypothetical protein
MLLACQSPDALKRMLWLSIAVINVEQYGKYNKV